jgi:hypothetical protein
MIDIVLHIKNKIDTSQTENNYSYLFVYVTKFGKVTNKTPQNCFNSFVRFDC